MAKKSKGAKALDKAQQKLAKAQLALHVAQAKRAQAITRGEHEIERVRQRAAAREQKATTRLEKRAAAVARAEAALLSLTDKQGPSSRDTARRSAVAVVAGADTPETAAEVLEQEVPPPDAGPIVVPDSVEVTTTDETTPLDADTHNSSGPTW